MQEKPLYKREPAACRFSSLSSLLFYYLIYPIKVFPLPATIAFISSIVTVCDAYLNSDTNTGITSITVSSVSTTVTNESNQMKIETNVTAAIERRTRFLHFFRKTKIETVTWKLESVVTLENEKWVMGSDFLKGVELSK